MSTTTHAHNTHALVHYQNALDQLRHGLTPSALAIESAASCLTSLLMRDAVVVLMTGVALPSPDRIDKEGLPAALVADSMATILDRDRGRRPDSTVALHVDLLTRIVTHLSPTECAPAHTLLALVAWWSGETGTASHHVKEALTVDPEYRLAHLVAYAIACAIQPGWVTTNH